MATPTQPVGFSSLPPELQTKIYGYILAATSEEPSSRNLAQYAGLLLSCKQVASNFEYEWAKDYNSRLQQLTKGTNLRPLIIKKYSYATHLRIVVTPISQWSGQFHIPELMRITNFYTMKLLHPAHDLTVSAFLRSTAFDLLMALRQGIAGSGTIAARIDFGTQEIHCFSRHSTMTYRTTALDELSYGIFWSIAEEMLSRDTTMEELCGTLSGWNQSCRSWQVLLVCLSDVAQYRYRCAMAEHM